MKQAPLYELWYRKLGLRKKQNIANPMFLSLAELSLPLYSTIHYLAKHENELGPSPSETLISNWLGENIYINFVNTYTPYIGSIGPAVFDLRKNIKKYRASHFNYSWIMNINDVYKRRENLIVWNHACANKTFKVRASLFATYERYYNDFRNVIESVNTVTEKGLRNQFLRIELPNRMPNFLRISDDLNHFAKVRREYAKTGKMMLNKEMMRQTKGESCYWVLELLSFLLTDLATNKKGEEAEEKIKISLFNLLNDESKHKLNIVFSYQGTGFVVNLGLLESWFKELRDDGSRVNGFKRFYLSLIKLSSTEMVLEDENEEIKNTVEETTEEPEELDEDESEAPIGKDEQKVAVHDTTPILDIFADQVDSDDGSLQSGGDEGGEDDSGEPAEQSWTDPVDDSLFEEPEVATETDSGRNVFADPSAGIERSLRLKGKENGISAREYALFKKKSESYKNIVLPNGETMETFMKIDEKELRNLDGKIKGTFETVKDPSLLQSRTSELRKGYVKKFLHKDIIRTLVAFQNSGTALTDLSITEEGDKEGMYEIYNAQFHPVGGSVKTVPIRMPKVLPDCTIMIDGNKSYLQNQRMELPIRKVRHDEVMLSSFYGTRLSLKRSRMVKDDYHLWLLRQIIKGDKINGYQIALGRSKTSHLKVPQLYYTLAAKFKSIAFDDMTFVFSMDTLIEEDPAIEKLNSPDSVVIGKKGDKYITLDAFNNVYVGDELKGGFTELVKIDQRKAPVDMVSLLLNNVNFPIVILLCYYFGIDKLLQVTKANYRVVPSNEKTVLTNDEFKVVFNDETLVFNRNDRVTTLIFGGLVGLKNLSNFNRVDLNNNDNLLTVMGSESKAKITHFYEMERLYRLFIDPITKDELIRLKYSVDFDYLLLDAVELLKDSYHRNEVEIEEQRISGYERLVGHMYTQLCRANREYGNKTTGKKVFSLNPDAVLMAIQLDTSLNQVEEVNPFHQIKSDEEVTFGGTGGRGDDVMVARTRAQLQSYRGVISEAHKDNQKVGYVTHLTSDARISDYRGNIDSKETITNAGLASVTGNLYYGSFKDDPKRTSFSNGQASQIMASTGYQVNPMRTGYEVVMPHRNYDLYTKVAEQDGVVTEVTDKYLLVTYKDGSTDTYLLGYEVGSAAGEYHKHNKVTDLKVGDKFKAGEVIGFNDVWFARDFYNPGQVAAKTGILTGVALTQGINVYEDSISISADFAKKSSSSFIKQISFSAALKDTIVEKIKVGQTVDHDQVLFEVIEESVAALNDENEDAADINRLGIRQVKSNHHGVIKKVEVSYNGDYADMSSSVLKFVKPKDKEVADLAKVTKSKIVDNRVSGGKNVPPGRIKVRVYIDAEESSVVADKFVVGNQMKCTVNSIYTKRMYTQSGIPIDLTFSYKSLFGRMVLSLRDKLVGNQLTEIVSKQFVDIYRGEQ